MTQDDDIRDAQIHGAITTYFDRVRATFGLSRQEALYRFIAFVENDEECPVLAQLPAPKPAPKKRRRIVHQEAAA